MAGSSQTFAAVEEDPYKKMVKVKVEKQGLHIFWVTLPKLVKTCWIHLNIAFA